MSRPATAEAQARPPTAWRSWLADPAVVFAAIALAAGTVLIWVIPPFAGVDEPGHFARTWQLTSGHPVPVEASDDSVPGGGACLPVEVAHELETRAAVEFVRAVQIPSGQAGGRDDLLDTPAPAEGSGCGDPDEQFVEFATFSWYTPLGYAPQALAVGSGRILGLGPVGLARAARLATLVAFVVVTTIAIRRSPAARWGFAAIGLLPATLFQAASSISPDALTIAFAIAVVSSALRMAADPERPLRSCMVEASILSTLLALSKPTYGLMCLVYLITAIGPRGRAERWRLAIPATGAIAVALVWQRAFQHLWRCDLRYFNVPSDPQAQVDELLGGPHRFVAGLMRATVDHAGRWADGLVQVESRVVDWHRFAVIAVLVGFAVVALLRQEGDAVALHWSQRVALVVPVCIGVSILFGGWYVYCNPVGFDLAIPPAARLFVPFLPPLVAAATAGPGSRLAIRRGGRWLTMALAAFTALWVAGVSARMN